MSRSRLFAAALGAALAGGLTAGGAEPGGNQTEDPIVSSAESGVVRYAALRSEDGRARALARFLAWRHAVQRDEVFVSVQLVAMELAAGPGWADAPFAIRMDAGSGGRRIVGTDHTEYDANPEPGVGEVRPFRTDAAGKMRWLDFVEPDERETPLDRFHNHAPDMRVSATRLGLSESDRRAAVELTLTHGRTGEEIRLKGPDLQVPDRVWNLTPPEPKVMGLLETLNPFHRGSVWAWLANSARYGHCIDERRHAKRWFLDSGPTRAATRDPLQASA